MSPDTYRQVALPLNIGATKFTNERVSGPPSRMFPALRDLIHGDFGTTQDLRIEIEIDTEGSRYVGHIARDAVDVDEIEIRQKAVAGTGYAVPIAIPLHKVLAFRVLNVEAKDA